MPSEQAVCRPARPEGHARGNEGAFDDTTRNNMIDAPEFYINSFNFLPAT
jgi:hypothetical protein